MFRKVSDLVPQILADELLRLARLDRNWAEWHRIDGGPQYSIRTKFPTWIRRGWKTGADGFAAWGVSIWLIDGPKVFRPTVDQCKAMEQIEVRLELSEYSQPYPALLVDLPTGYEPFTSVLCFKTGDMLSCNLNSPEGKDDITTTIAVDGRPIEVSIQRFDDDCAILAEAAGRALRVALNSCLALSSYGHTADFLYPAEATSDLRLAKEDTERGHRARKRVQTTCHLIKFAQDIVLHRTVRGKREPGEPTGVERPFHWRKGHWCMQPYGPGNSQRKRILRPPVFVRADKFFGDLSDTSVTYHS